MYICRTLDYIVNTDLHLYFFTKFNYIKNKGIKVEIELVESITCLPIDYKKYIEIIDIVIDNTIEMLMESLDKKIKFYMFHTEKDLHLVIQHPTIANYSSKILDRKFKKYRNAFLYDYAVNEGDLLIRHLVVTP